MDEMMQAIRFSEYGGPEQLRIERVRVPELRPGSALVRVMAAAVNPWDWKLRMGAMKQFMPIEFPYTPGLEMAGIIEALDPQVTEFRIGQPVLGHASGAYAEYVVAPASGLAPKPASLSFDQAAAVSVGASTAWRALFEAADLQSGQRVLILGAAGGVGSFAVQLARWKGAYVLGTASAGNLDFIRSMGANEAVDYHAVPVEETARDLDVVLDTVGGEAGVRALPTLRAGGILVTIAGQPPQEQAQALGLRAASLARANTAQTGEVTRSVCALIDTGRIKVVVPNILPLAEAARAHALSESRHGQGRIVLHVAD
jgi:NADPH:quinone reductase-like Zn-dependent oxidoreductase